MSDSRIRELERNAATDLSFRIQLYLEHARNGNIDVIRNEINRLIGETFYFRRLRGRNSEIDPQINEKQFSIEGLYNMPSEDHPINWRRGGYGLNTEKNILMTGVLLAYFDFKSQLVTIGAKNCPFDGASPGRAWKELQPWRMVEGFDAHHWTKSGKITYRTVPCKPLLERLKSWGSTGDVDHITIPFHILDQLKFKFTIPEPVYEQHQIFLQSIDGRTSISSLNIVRSPFISFVQ